MNTQPIEFTLSDNEKIVRTYECTKLHKWFAQPILGHLTVTTKRVVYHSSGKSATGSSTLISEMPVQDVAGISTMVSNSINWFLFLVFAAVIYFGSQIISEILPPFFSSWYLSIILMIPFGIYWLFEKRILSAEIKEQLAENIKQSPAGSIINKKDGNFYQRLFQILFFVGVIFLARFIALNTELGWDLSPINYVFLLAVYYWVFTVFFGRQRTFRLTVLSRTAKGSGIYIPGDVFNLLLNRNSSALGTLNAGPAGDAEIIVKELGAMLTDIQQLGEFGVQKWTS